jgi:hypothetical protein
VNATVTAGLGTITTVTGTPVAGVVPYTLNEYQIDPFDPENLGNWTYLHQVMHNQAWATFGTAGYDLTGIDWQDPQVVQNWIAIHSDEHNRLSAALGLN